MTAAEPGPETGGDGGRSGFAWRVSAGRPAWSRRLSAAGDDPDPRFTFANERTFLAWIRTSLALIAAGIGVDSFADDLPDWGRRSLAALLVLLGGLLALSAFR